MRPFIYPVRLNMQDQRQASKQEPKRIHIGHTAYHGANAFAVATSKSEATRILRDRGMTRDKARAVIHQTCAKPYGYQTVRNDTDDVIEVNNPQDIAW